MINKDSKGPSLGGQGVLLAHGDQSVDELTGLDRLGPGRLDALVLQDRARQIPKGGRSQGLVASEFITG